MSTTVTISPVTRIEGHLGIRAETEAADTDGGTERRIAAAHCEGEMFRGFERILAGRDPLDAQQITQRICGVCPIAHGIASVGAQETAYGIKPNHNGRLLQNLILAANYLQSHILHFYHLAALDFVDVTAVLAYTGSDRTLKTVKTWVETSVARQDSFPAAPFLPRCEGTYIKDVDRNARLLRHYLEALELRRLCHEMGAVFGARLPHSTALIPGGCTQVPTTEHVLAYSARLRKVRAFIDEVYLPDLLEVAGEFPAYFDIGAGYGNYMCYGVFPVDDVRKEDFIPSGVVIEGKWDTFDPGLIREDVTCSRYADQDARHPDKGETEPVPDKSGAYSWLKAPRYIGHPMEVGPLARVMVNYLAPGQSQIKRDVDAFLGKAQLPAAKLASVLGRHVARGLEASWVARESQAWISEIEVDAPAATDFDIPRTASGHGLTEAPRGALGHWLSIEDHRISHYQCVVPTTWNCSPRDSAGKPGPVEKALEGLRVADAEHPIEAGRVVRSFDPCIACAVH